MKNQVIKQVISLISGLTLAVVSVVPAFAQTASGSLFFDPSTATTGVGQAVAIDIKANTAGQDVVGVDAIMIYDPTYLGSPSVDGGSGQPGGFIVFPLTNLDPTGPNGMKRTGVSWLKSTSTMDGVPPANINSSSGQVATISFVPLKVGTTVITFDAPDSTLASTTGVNLLSSNNGTVTITITENQVGGPVITSISPTSGSKDLAQNVTVYGSDFGNYVANQSKVYIGTKLTTIVNGTWTASSVQVTVPAEPTLPSNSTRQIKVHRSDGLEATNVGYTYLVSGFDDPIISGNAPYISSIQPTQGNYTDRVEMIIYGGNFGYYSAENSGVMIGLTIAEVLDWSDKRVVISVPTQPDLLSSSTRSVKVVRSDGQMAEYLGYRYLVQSGPEHIALWGGLILLSLGLAWLVYRRFSYAPSTVRSLPIETGYVANGDSQIRYRF